MYKNNSNAIKVILDWLITTTKLTAVYDYDVKIINSYPIAKISVMDWEWSFFDTNTNKFISQYKIVILNENKTVATSEPIMRELIDEILIELHKKDNVTLWGIVDRFVPISVNWGWTDTNEPLRICEIICETMESVNI